MCNVFVRGYKDDFGLQSLCLLDNDLDHIVKELLMCQVMWFSIRVLVRDAPFLDWSVKNVKEGPQQDNQMRLFSFYYL